MAGHSKWSKVKRISGAIDVKRGRLFSKLTNAITVAARIRGGDPSGYPAAAPPWLPAACRACRMISL
jgi:transcriptional/translational regulatory protein YebC/TACO1